MCVWCVITTQCNQIRRIFKGVIPNPNLRSLIESLSEAGSHIRITLGAAMKFDLLDTEIRDVEFRTDSKKG